MKTFTPEISEWAHKAACGKGGQLVDKQVEAMNLVLLAQGVLM